MNSTAARPAADVQTPSIIRRARTFAAGLVASLAVFLYGVPANANVVGDGLTAVSNELTANLGLIVPAGLIIVATLIGVGFLVRFLRRAVSS